MGILLRLFGRREAQPSMPLGPTPDQLLLTSFLDLERSRLERRGELEAKRDELEVRKLELELNHLETRTRMDIETAKAREDLRNVKRENAKNFMRKKRADVRANGNGGANGCPLCADENYRGPQLTVELIRAHRGHEVRAAAPVQPAPLAHVGWNGPSGPEESGN